VAIETVDGTLLRQQLREQQQSVDDQLPYTEQPFQIAAHMAEVAGSLREGVNATPACKGLPQQSGKAGSSKNHSGTHTGSISPQHRQDKAPAQAAARCNRGVGGGEVQETSREKAVER
jgi:hypothetical protein